MRSAVSRIGVAKDAELVSLTRSTTRDLMGRLPQADKVYLEQMMYATYCSALRDDSSLAESQKSARIRAYNLEMRKALYGRGEGQQPRGNIAKDAARKALDRIPLPYTPDAFVESAGKGNLAAVKLYLVAGMDPNAKAEGSNEWGTTPQDTPLMLASKGGYAQVVEVLLKAGANVNQTNYYGEDALYWAAQGGHVDLVRMLVKAGADKHHPSEVLASLMFSGSNREADFDEVVRFLLASGANVNTKNKSGGTALIDAALRGNATVVQTLLHAGADVNAEDSEGWTALLYAVDDGHEPVARTLLDAGAKLNAKCTCTGYAGGGWTALMMASRRSDSLALAKELLARGADPNIANNDGKNALMIAVEQGHDVDLVSALLEKGADVNAKDKEGATVLMRSAYTNSEMLRVLLQHHANVNAADKDGWTVTMYAAYAGDVENVEALLDVGADLNARDVKGKTALMQAVRGGRVEMVRVLLRRGARVKDEDADGKSVLNYAEEDLKDNERTEMLRVLKKAGGA